MRRALAIFVFVALAGSLALAQFTTVTGTITDPNSVPYSNGNITAQLITAGTTPTLNGLPFSMSGSSGLDVNGKFTMRLADNTQIVPGGLQWKFTVTCGGGCVPPAGGTGPQQFSVSITISGATQDISATLSAAAPALTRASGGTPAFGSVLSGTNTNALVMGQGGSLTPSNSSITIPGGQITSTGEWLPMAPGNTLVPPSPTLTANAAGGSLVCPNTYYFRITYVGPAVVMPSGEVRTGLPTGGCGANVGQVVVTMPTTCTAGNLPSGVTGCTVWSTQNGVNLEQQQTANSACVNITTATCTVNAMGTGAGLTWPAVASMGISPAGAQTNNCPDNLIPVSWFQKGDLNNYPLFGIDTTAMNTALAGAPNGVPTFCNKVFFNNKNTPPLIANVGLLSVDHGTGVGQNTAGVGGTTVNADFGVGFEDVDSTTNVQSFTQTLTQYNERTFNNPNLSCSPAGTESCAAGSRAVFADGRTSGAITPGGLGFNGGAFVAFNNMNSGAHGTTGGTFPYVGLIGVAQDGTVGGGYNEGGIAYVGVAGQATYVGTASNAQGVNFYATKGGNFPNGNLGLFVNSWTSARNTDYAVFANGGNIFFGGAAEAPVYLDNFTTNHGTIAIVGSESTTGDLQTVAIAPNATIGPVSPQGTGGATTWTYNGACEMADGTVSVYTTPRSTTVGNANLTGTNFNNLISGPPNGCVAVDWYRTAAGGTCNSGACGTGWIGRTTIPLSPSIAALPPTATVTFNDTGIVATGGTTPPPGNTNNTGAVLTSGLVNGTNTAKIASNFTTTNAALTAITGLITPHLYNTAAQSYTIVCYLQYSVSANTAVAFGVQATLNNPTNLAALGDMQITSGSPSAYVSGPGIQTLATTTATTIVSGTPTSAANQVYRALFQITIEDAAQTDNQMQLMADIAGGNTLTVYRGGSCTVQP